MMWSPLRSDAWPRQPERIRRVLVFRQGSLGDTVVALPALHLIARAFPSAERRVLTNAPVSNLAPPLPSMLAGSGLVHDSFAYPLGLRSPAGVARLVLRLHRFRPDLTIYLNSGAEPARVRRDHLLLRLAAGAPVVATPLSAELHEHRRLSESLWEAESHRLARCLAPLGDAAPDDPASYDLRLGPAERAVARQALAPLGGRAAFALCIGGKVSVKDWEDRNWMTLLQMLAASRPDLALVSVGATDEAARSRRLLASWPGPTLDLCGRLTPRKTAAALAEMRLYLGHDAGPMHLAAAVGTPCVAVFSAQAKPGVWYPAPRTTGPRHRIFYNRTDCFDCRLAVCTAEGKRCILGIAPEPVAAAVLELLEPAA